MTDPRSEDQKVAAVNASMVMAGQPLSAEDEAVCRRILRGEISADEAVLEYLEENWLWKFIPRGRASPTYRGRGVVSRIPLRPGSSSGSLPLLDDHAINDNYFQLHLGKRNAQYVIV